MQRPYYRNNCHEKASLEQAHERMEERERERKTRKMVRNKMRRWQEEDSPDLWMDREKFRKVTTTRHEKTGYWGLPTYIGTTMEGEGVEFKPSCFSQYNNKNNK